jgi:hypothetical protein
VAGGHRDGLRSGDVKVEVVRSPRRRKTVQAREVDGVLRVSIPATMTKADEDRWVAEMVRRMKRRAGTAQVDLAPIRAFGPRVDPVVRQPGVALGQLHTCDQDGEDLVAPGAGAGLGPRLRHRP